MRVFKVLLIIYALFLLTVRGEAFPIKITEIDTVEKKIRALRQSGVPAKDIAVVLDFHGVISNQSSHAKGLSLKGAVRQFLEYLSEDSIHFVVGTAWNKFSEVEEGVAELGLSDLLELEKKETKEVFYLLGSEESNLQGFVNGRVTALKYTNIKDRFYRQKAFSLEARFGEQNYKYVFFVDDDIGNHGIFAVDFKKTKMAQSKPELLLYHLIDAPLVAPNVIGRATSEDDDTSSDSLDILKHARAIHSSGEGESDFRELMEGRDNLKDSQ